MFPHPPVDPQISFDEFRTFFENIPNLSLVKATQHLLKIVSMDTGSDLAPALPPPDMPLWRFLAAGSCGGFASRTCTAPLERMVILSQTNTGSPPWAVCRRVVLCACGRACVRVCIRALHPCVCVCVCARAWK